MMILFIVLFILLAIPLFLVGCICYYLIRQPLVRFYRKRSADPDFYHYDKIPKDFVHFILQIEDDAFFDHRGFRFDMIRVAFKNNKKNHTIVSGGSTVTQQLIKNLYFNFKHNYLRKLIEAGLTVYAEHVLSKREIIELFLNIIYFGNGKYGVVDAARFFFDKNVEDLSLNQQFMLACMPFAPTVGNPLKHPDVFLRVRDKRLYALKKRKVISESDMKHIICYDEKCLDPELRICGEEEKNYSDEIVLINERFGLPGRYNKN